ncbi:hypothetical protein ACMU59_004188 [Yersinia enterocolitica]
MAGEIKTGGLAFPFNDIGGDCYPGMTLRDYLAAKAMQATLSNPNCDYYKDDLAEWSYQVADAMIKARG